MIWIDGIKIETFSSRMAFMNNTSACDDKYGYLERAIMRSKVHRDGHNYLIGENICLKNEYMKYASNTLIVAEQDNEFKFIVIIKGKIFDVTSDIDNNNKKCCYQLINLVLCRTKIRFSIIKESAVEMAALFAIYYKLSFLMLQYLP